MKQAIFRLFSCINISFIGFVTFLIVLLAPTEQTTYIDNFFNCAFGATTYIDFYVRRHCAEGFNLVAGLVVAFAPTPRD